MQDLTRFFAGVYRMSQLFFSHELKDTQIKVGQFMYILCIYDNPGITQDQMAGHLLVAKSAVTKAVQGLLQQEYISRGVHDDDKRSYKLYPTEKANSVCKEIRQVQKKWESYLMKDMSDVEQDIFLRILDKVHIEDCRNQSDPLHLQEFSD